MPLKTLKVEQIDNKNKLQITVYDQAEFNGYILENCIDYIDRDLANRLRDGKDVSTFSDQEKEELTGYFQLSTFYHMLEWNTCNQTLQVLTSNDIGALTDDSYLTFDASLDDDGFVQINDDAIIYGQFNSGLFLEFVIWSDIIKKGVCILNKID